MSSLCSGRQNSLEDWASRSRCSCSRSRSPPALQNEGRLLNWDEEWVLLSWRPDDDSWPPADLEMKIVLTLFLNYLFINGFKITEQVVQICRWAVLNQTLRNNFLSFLFFRAVLKTSWGVHSSLSLSGNCVMVYISLIQYFKKLYFSLEQFPNLEEQKCIWSFPTFQFDGAQTQWSDFRMIKDPVSIKQSNNTGKTNMCEIFFD